jgi:NAD(P)-dependent dehydrogenase (short-subunit alcohol dehydrogenase family)
VTSAVTRGVRRPGDLQVRTCRIGHASPIALTRAGRPFQILPRSRTPITLKTDVTKEPDLERLFATVGDRHGRIDVLFANAGVAKVAPLETTSQALFDEIMDTNFRGAYFTVQKALSLLQDGGAIVFTTSYFDQVGIAGTSVVSASKAALRSLTRTLAAELLPRKIRVNAISPGAIATPLFGKLGLPPETVTEVGNTLLAQIPVKRFGTPEEIARAVTFLASGDASYVTGTELTVDGGRTELERPETAEPGPLQAHSAGGRSNAARSQRPRWAPASYAL